MPVQIQVTKLNTAGSQGSDSETIEVEAKKFPTKLSSIDAIESLVQGAMDFVRKKEPSPPGSSFDFFHGIAVTAGNGEMLVTLKRDTDSQKNIPVTVKYDFGDGKYF
uniref:Uncharacterized protein n=1 Tax=Chromera velia CCMP2878 TaxID=1169474 RepID=A0A0G4G0G7_9ALVE|eukprot:Cvel_19538.t1-p1 / transcript=Cvel_19538.t1 / gene=Cvel_19538 / organism=Chromera_velia_CCMP2878 / gene_product=hypothetical protein / transcript_product=hypothetical protein / location=Cvel_scaffold1692:3674-3991(+) / protein_length=106 / sequence_SO=supercontig / SO=protein_coding / is_pseudo=false